MCGPQLENVNAAPEFPSSYIPHNNGSSATRVKDVLKYDGNLNAFGIRESLLKYAEDFDSWTQTEITSITAGQADPFGGTGADLVLTTGGTQHRLDQHVTYTGTVATFGCYVKNVDTAGPNGMFLFLDTSTSSYQYIDLTNGTIDDSLYGAGLIDAGVIDVGNGWYRFWVTGTVAPGSRVARIGSEADDSSFYLYGATIYEGSVDYGYNPNRAGTAEFSLLWPDITYAGIAVPFNIGVDGDDRVTIQTLTGETLRTNTSASGQDTGSIQTSAISCWDGAIHTARIAIGGGSVSQTVDAEKLTDSSAALTNYLTTIEPGSYLTQYQSWALIGPVKLYSKG